MFNFAKIFRSKEQDSELMQKDIGEASLFKQNELNSEKDLYELSLVNKGKVTLHFTGASPADGALLVGFFISNGLKKKIQCVNVSLVLIDSNRRVLARQSFDGETIGEIVSGTAKACVARFLPENIYVKDVPADCQVCFAV
ncbi:SLAP domain-containing protein [Desulfosporosinus fructosivorans]